MRKAAIYTCALLLTSCASLESFLDHPVQVTDQETGQTVEAPLGDVVAEAADPVASSVGTIVGAFNPVLGLMAAGAVGTLIAGARRKKPTPS